MGNIVFLSHIALEHSRTDNIHKASLHWSKYGTHMNDFVSDKKNYFNPP